MKRHRRYLRAVGVGLLLIFTLAVGLVGGVVVDRRVLARFVPLPTMPRHAHPDFALMAEAWNAIERSYVDKKAVRPQAMTYGAISGMMESLGDTGHSGFLTPEMLRSIGTLAKGGFTGVGLEVRKQGQHYAVVSPMDGSPAQRAGLRPGDLILHVDGEDVSGLPLDELVRRIGGPAGTRVTLRVVSPEHGQRRDVVLTREEIKLRNVRWELLPGTRVAHLRIAEFSQGVTRDLRAALRDIEAARASGVVLDLRDDPGGLLDEAVGVASQFLRGGTVLREKDVAGKVTEVPVQPDGVAPDVPLVVLVNKGTASAAEIVAGALQDAARGPVVGETTFGTGTVLRPFPLSDGSAVLLAVGEWLTPKGRSFWRKGIAPSRVVTLPPHTSPLFPDGQRTSAAALRESGDRQLLQAVELLAGPALVN